MARHTRKTKRTLDVRSEKEVEKLNSLMNQAPFTLVLIYADWCPHCHEYLPTWDEFANLPGRTANMAKVHFDMQEKIPTIANSKINGYPSVIKVRPDGTVEEFKDESGESTNALPNMRDKAEMMKNLMIKPVSANKLFGKNRSNKMRRNWATIGTDSATANTATANTAIANTAIANTAIANTAIANTATANTATAETNEATEEKAVKKENAEKETNEAKKAIQEGANQTNKTKNINIHPGVLTSKDIDETANELIKQRGGRRKKIRSFLSGGTIIEDLRALGAYLKK